MREHLFPDHHQAGRDERVVGWWNLDYPLPVPHVMPPCPSCGLDGLVTLKDWRPHTRPESRSPWRIDVRLKCLECSLVLEYGVAVPRDYYYALASGHARGQRYISWRAGRRILSRAGFFGGPDE